MPKRYSVSSVVLYLLFLAGIAAAQNAPLDLDKYQSFEGFVDAWWDEDTGRMLVRVENFDTPFIYQTSLPRGVGSNDIGLDRGQLGTTKIVRFLRSGPKILLVEDNEMNRDMLSRRLRRKGFEVTTAEDGSACMEALAAATPDVVLMDISLPGRDGYQVRAHATWVKTPFYEKVNGLVVA